MHKYIILIIGILVSLSAYAQQEFPNSPSPDFEDKVLQELNRFRTQPQQMADWYMASSYYDEKDRVDQSLLQYLKSIHSMDSLSLDTGLTSAAHCHAYISGHKSHVGHGRISDCPTDFDAECIQYGLQQPLDVLMELLEDHGNPDYGHRKILLDADYATIGIAQAFHGVYRYNTVMDLRK